MVHRARVISSSSEIFDGCARLRSIFSHLDHSITLVNSTIQSVANEMSTLSAFNSNKVNEIALITICLSYKEKRAADTVRRQMRNLGNEIGFSIQPVFTSRKLEQVLKPKETKPLIVNKQCVHLFIYLNVDLCDADYVGYTTRHLQQRIAEH